MFNNPVSKFSQGTNRMLPAFYVIALLLLTSVPGCLFVRTTEHIVKLNADRSGEGIIHLIDIRSDARTDSLVRQDFDDLMTAYGSDSVEDFEKSGRKITGKQLRVSGDTLMAEVTYMFHSLEAIEGLRMTKEGMSLVFTPDREVVRSNGKVSRTDKNETQIMWELGSQRLVYEVREKNIPVSTSLAPFYRKYLH